MGSKSRKIDRYFHTSSAPTCSTFFIAPSSSSSSSSVAPESSSGMPPRVRCFLLLSIAVTTITFYLNSVTVTLSTDFNNAAHYPSGNQSSARQGSSTSGMKLKKVVAYSLKKRVAIDGREFHCNKMHLDTMPVNSVTSDDDDGWREIGDSKLFVSGAYYDTRLQPYRYVRIIGMVKGLWNGTMYCQFPSSNNYIITKAQRREIWWQHWDQPSEDTFNPVLISCFVPPSLPTVSHVFLNTNICVKNSIKIPIFHMEKRFDQNAKNRNSTPTITICTKSLDFREDISRELMEWIEINRILGVQRFDFAVNAVHERTWKLLEFYKGKFGSEFSIVKAQSLNDILAGKTTEVDAQDEANTPWNLIEIFKEMITNGNGKSPDPDSKRSRRIDIWQKRRNELIVYNNCFYRNLYTSDFVLPLDIDEVVVPRESATLRQLLAALPAKVLQTFASFSVQNAYFLEQFHDNRIPPHDEPFFLKYRIRSELSPRGESGKSFVATHNTLTVFNHYAMEVLRPGVHRSFFLAEADVQMNHYKRSCLVDLLPECAKYVSSAVRILDTITDKYRKQFRSRYGQVQREFAHFLNEGT